MSEHADFITTNEAAGELGVSRQRVLQLIQDGRIKAEKFANVYMIRRRDLSNIEEKPMGRPPKAKAEAATNGAGRSAKKSARKKAA
jgi:excisionase family DNA binding protein